MEVDSDYEFNAPMYMDFLSNEVDNEYTDTWFDENPEGHEGGIRISQVPFIAQHSNFQAATRAISAALTGCDGGDGKATEVVNNVPEAECKPEIHQSEIAVIASQHTAAEATEEDDAEVRTEERETTNVEVGASSDSNEDLTERESNIVKNSGDDGAYEMTIDAKVEVEETVVVKGETSNNTEDNVQKSETDELKNVEKSGVKKATRSRSSSQSGRTPLSAFRKRKHSINQKGSANGKDKKDISEKKSEIKKPKLDVKKPLVTMPNTPSFLRRLRGKSNNEKKTSEALEIERIKALQEETKKRLKVNESSLQKVLAPTASHQTKRAMDVTKTMEFTFATDARIKSHPMKTRADRPGSGDFFGQLRKHPPSPNFKNRVTKPQPFKFSSGGRPSKQQQNEWKSVASSVNDFQTKTPERWRSRPINQQNAGPDAQNKSKVKVEMTHPKTPQLTTKTRSRPLNVPSQADIESKIAEEMSSYKFKARGFDHRLVDLNGMCGVDPMKQLPITEAKPFSFQSDARLEHRKKMEDEKKDKEQTIKQQQQQEHGHEKRNTSIDSNHAGKKKAKITEAKPFSFESRDKEMMRKKQEKILKVYEDEEKAREFHARPLPSLSPDLIPVKSGKHTDAAPFKLATDERGAVKEEKWSAQLMQERDTEKEHATFKAKPCKVIHQDAFKVKPALRPLTNISEFKLSTEERSKKRENYEIIKKELQRVKEDEIQQSLKERQEEEAKEIALLRKQAVHKANPIRQFGNFVVKPSDQPLTLPETPKFETKKRFGKLSRV